MVKCLRKDTLIVDDFYGHWWIGDDAKFLIMIVIFVERLESVHIIEASTEQAAIFLSILK